MIDPIVDEVRGFRREHAQSFNFDLHAICADIREFEACCGHEVVKLPPKKLESAVNRRTEPFNQPCVTHCESLDCKT
jgi:hypothetical protein